MSVDDFVIKPVDWKILEKIQTRLGEVITGPRLVEENIPFKFLDENNKEHDLILNSNHPASLLIKVIQEFEENYSLRYSYNMRLNAFFIFLRENREELEKEKLIITRERDTLINHNVLKTVSIMKMRKNGIFNRKDFFKTLKTI